MVLVQTKHILYPITIMLALAIHKQLKYKKMVVDHYQMVYTTLPLLFKIYMVI